MPLTCILFIRKGGNQKGGYNILPDTFKSVNRKANNTLCNAILKNVAPAIPQFNAAEAENTLALVKSPALISPYVPATRPPVMATCTKSARLVGQLSLAKTNVHEMAVPLATAKGVDSSIQDSGNTLKK